MKYFYIISIIIIIILLSLYILRDIEKSDLKLNEKAYRDSIEVYQNKISKLDSTNTELQIKNNNLELTKQKAKIIYLEKIKFINGLTIGQLDSIIKSDIN